MAERGFWQLDTLTDDELMGGLRDLLQRSARTEARVVAHLAEVEARRLHLRGAESLFVYCQKRLGLSHNEAFYRIVAARMGRKYPSVFELLESRQVHLTSLSLIRDYISAENHVELLREISGKTKRQILELLATRQPRPDTKNRVRRLPVQSNQVAAGPTGTLEPLSAASYSLQLCISSEVEAKLTLAADLMSHANPSRDLAVVVERALDLLIAKLRQRRFGETARAAGVSVVTQGLAKKREGGDVRERAHDAEVERESPAERVQREQGQGANAPTELKVKKPRAPGDPRDRIANSIRRQLIARDGCGCTFVLDDGTRCGAQSFLQIHHDEAWSKGGLDELGNLRLVCGPHNRLLAEDEMSKAC